MKIIYIEVQTKNLFIAFLKKRLTSFFVHDPQIYNLQNLEITNNSISNPTLIQQHINSFISKHQLRKPKIILCVPHTQKQEGLLQQFSILQATLCVSKLHLEVISVISQSLINPTASKYMQKLLIKIPATKLKKQSNLLLPFSKFNQKKPYKWIISTLVSLFMLGTILSFAYLDKQKQFLLKTKIHHDKSSKLAALAVKSAQLKKEENETKDKLESIKSVKKLTSNKNLADLMEVVAKSIESESWINSMEIYKEKNKKPNDLSKEKMYLRMDGSSLKPKQISSFVKHLSSKKQIKSASINKLNKDDGSKNPKNKSDNQNLYNFSILCELCL
jgi:hypothetical protein